MNAFDPLRDFARDGVRLLKRCQKSDRQEFTKMACRTALGFVAMGLAGYVVKAVFIPVNNIILSST